MIIVVGSKNPIKVAAVQAAFSRVWESATAMGVSVSTGVSEMPLSDAECVTGARNRAIAALKSAENAAFGVGLEGGVNREPYGVMLLGWVVIVARDGRESVACTPKIPLPNGIAQQVMTGRPLGPLMDELLGTHEIAKRGGASGALSAGLVKRQDKFEIAVAYALSPFVAPELYAQ